MKMPGDFSEGLIDAFVQYNPLGRGLGALLPPGLAERAERGGDTPISYLFRQEQDASYRRRYEQSQDFDAWRANLAETGIVHTIIPIGLDWPREIFDQLHDVRDLVSLAVRLDPHDGMAALRTLSELVVTYPSIKAVSLSPHQIYPLIPPNSKEYYPVYAKCVELDLAVYINVGFPGPRVPAFVQDPLHLDEVCWFFEDLRVVMRHGGEPWADVCVKMLLRWPHLYYATTAFAPRYYPEAIVEYMNSRGAEKVIFAGYWPVLSHQRIFRELEESRIQDRVLHRFLRHNAVEAFKLPITSEDKHARD